MLRALAATTLAALLAACGGGDPEPDPCAVDPAADVVVGCPACSNNDTDPWCPPLMPPWPPAPGSPS